MITNSVMGQPLLRVAGLRGRVGTSEKAELEKGRVRMTSLHGQHLEKRGLE